MKLARCTVIAAVLLGACRSSTAPVTIPVLPYDEGPVASPPAYMWSSASDSYLTLLHSKYSIGEVMEGASNDLERVKAASRWVHTQFAHDGNHASTYADPIGILEQAATGQRFRCVEYAAVTAGVLTSVGIPSRMVWLLTSTEGTRTDGLAHVVAEAWLRDQNKWVMVDAQWDVVPFVDGVPVSALQLQKAIAEKSAVTVASRSGTTSSDYKRWIAPYLYYFYSHTDNRVGVTRQPNAVLLTPIGDNSLAAKYPAPVHQLTHSVAAFYPTP